MVETDLLARVCAEIEQRMAELRPLLDEYERLLAADNALDSFEAAPADDEPPELPPLPAPSRRRARGPRGSAAGAIELASSVPPEPAAPAPEPEPAPPAPRVPRTPREPRILAGMPSLRTQPGLSALPSLSTAPAKPAPIVAEAPPAALPEPAVEEFEPEPELERRPASPSEVRQAILAALEHGSHTLSELVMVTAMSTPEIRAAASQLARQRKVTRVKREGDGKSAFALPASSAHT
jgi:hypothetical protein